MKLRIEADEIVKLLEKFDERADRWIEDATEREDYNDVFFYEGQKKVIEEIKHMVLLRSDK